MKRLWNVFVVWALAMAIVHAGLMVALSFVIWGAPPVWPGDWHWSSRTLYLIWALLAWTAAVKVEDES